MSTLSTRLARPQIDSGKSHVARASVETHDQRQAGRLSPCLTKGVSAQIHSGPLDTLVRRWVTVRCSWSRPQSFRVRSPVETVDDEVQAELERVAKVVSGFEYVLECQLGEVAVVVGGKMSRNLLGDLGENPPRRLPAMWLPRRQTRRRNCRGWRRRVPSSGSTTHRSADTR